MCHLFNWDISIVRLVNVIYAPNYALQATKCRRLQLRAAEDYIEANWNRPIYVEIY